MIVLLNIKISVSCISLSSIFRYLTSQPFRYNDRPMVRFSAANALLFFKILFYICLDIFKLSAIAFGTSKIALMCFDVYYCIDLVFVTHLHNYVLSYTLMQDIRCISLHTRFHTMEFFPQSVFSFVVYSGKVAS